MLHDIVKTQVLKPVFLFFVLYTPWHLQIPCALPCDFEYLSYFVSKELFVAILQQKHIL